MKTKSRNLLVVIGLLSSATLPSMAVGQNSTLQQAIQQTPGDEIPEAALLTEEGRQLVGELQRLRRAEASMGSKHPLLGRTREDIAAVKKKLAAWSPKAPKAAGGQPLAEALPAMNATALRQLILRMSVRIEMLERRVESLERKLEIF